MYREEINTEETALNGKSGTEHPAALVTFTVYMGVKSIMRLRNNLIVVNDIERARRFYHDLLGLDMLVELDGNMIEVGTPMTELQQ